MRRGTIFVVLFILLAVVVVGASQFIRSQPAVDVAIAVSPLAQDWIGNAVNAFNATDPIVGTTRVRFIVTPIDDINASLTTSPTWSLQNHPDAWIPAMSASVGYARESGLSFEIVSASLARTPLIWGGFTDTVANVTDDGAAPFDWRRIVERVESDRLTVAFSNPARSITGLGVLLAGAGSFNPNVGISEVTNADPFRDWIRPFIQSVPNFNTLGANVARTVAARGPSVGEIALLPESEWLTNLTGQFVGANPIQLHYPEVTFVFDFPMARWAERDANAPNAATKEAAIQQFATWLGHRDRQAQLGQFALRPVSGAASGERFTAAEPYGALLNPTFGEVTAPNRADAQRLLAWVGGIVR